MTNTNSYFYKTNQKNKYVSIDHDKLYDALMRRYHKGVIYRRDMQSLWCTHNDSIWCEMNKVSFLNYLLECAGTDNHINDISQNTMNQAYVIICAMVQDQCEREIGDEGVWRWARSKYSHIVAFQNNWVDVINMKLVEPTFKYYKTNVIPIIIHDTDDLKPQCPNWIKMVDRVYQGNKEMINLVQEMFGYCYLGDTRFSKLFILHGDGGTGKSVILKGLQTILNGDPESMINTCSVSMETFSQSHQLSTMFGKMANICDETPKFLAESTQIVKAISSGDPILINPKFKHPFSARLNTKLIFSSNSRPNFNEVNNAIARRVVLIPHIKKFNNTPEENKRVFEDEIIKAGETKGLVFWALEGLKRLLDNDNFTQPAESLASYEAMLVENDPIKDFCDKILVFTGNHEKDVLPASTIRLLWDSYRDDNYIKRTPRDYLDRIVKYSKNKAMHKSKRNKLGKPENHIFGARLFNTSDYGNDLVSNYEGSL